MKLLKLFILALMLFSALYVKYSQYLTYIAVCACGVLCFIVIYKRHSLRANKTVLSIFYLFTLTSFISAYVNGDTVLASGAIFLSILFAALFIVVPTMLGNKSNEFIYKAILLVHIPIIYIPLRNGIGITESYRGIFGNSNSLGVTCVCLFTAILTRFISVIHDHIETGVKINKKQALFFIATIPSLLFVTIYTGSRASVLTIIILIVLATMILMKQLSRIKPTKKFTGRLFRLMFIFSLFGAIAFKVFPIADKFRTIILYKFQMMGGQGDVLSRRGDIWTTSIHDAKLFGNGRDYFIELGIGAHNTYVSLLGQYGWLPTILFVLFLFVSLIYAIKYSIYALDDKYRLLPVLTLTGFMTLSLAEGMLFQSQMISAFVSVGVATVHYRKEKIKITVVPNFYRKNVKISTMTQ